MTFSLPHELLMKQSYENGVKDGEALRQKAIAEFIESRYPQLRWLAQEILHDDF
jgi:hypothetical protein